MPPRFAKAIGYGSKLVGRCWFIMKPRARRWKRESYRRSWRRFLTRAGWSRISNNMAISNGRPGFRVRDSWARPDGALLEAFGEASSAQIADCMSRLGAMDSGIRPVWASPRVIGAALTVWCHSGDNLMLHKALTLAMPGDIIVVNTQGNVTNSPFGELIATSAVQVGIRAVIVDGTVRDVEALQTLKLPVY